MEYKTREDVYYAKATPRHKLRTFEKKMFDIKECTTEDFVNFVKKVDDVRYMFMNRKLGTALSFIEYMLYNKSILVKHVGEPHDCDFHFSRPARRTKTSTPYSQRFHCRVYLFDLEIVIVTETETDLLDAETLGAHLVERFEHRIIRLKRVW